MKKEFEKQLLDTVYVHYPLRADASKTVEARAAAKTVAASQTLWGGDSLAPWRFTGEGEATLAEGGVLALRTHSVSNHWPESEVRAVSTQSGDYATFGSYVARLDTTGMDLSRGNRIRFEVRPLCNGLHSPIVRVAFVNNGAVKIPDQYSREGFNAINLQNGVWNECFWEMGSIAHDRVAEVSFEIHRYGKELSGGDELCFELRNIRSEEVEKPDVVLGWQPAAGTAVFSTTGYWANGVKTAVANTEERDFQVVEAETGAVAFAGPVQTVENGHGRFQVLDFTPLTQTGEYRIRLGGAETEAFAVRPVPVDEAVWKLLNFLYCERCGCPVPNKHGTCHGDVIATHNGLTMAFNGGWHDAADVSQQTVQSAEVLHALLEVAAAVKDSDPMLYARVLEEANWGLDFVLRTRFGDGYRASGAGIRRWTDGLIGNMDDCEARVHNSSFDNFVIAGVEADSHIAFEEKDPELAWKCLQTAREDFAFAHQRFARVGLEEPYFREHSTSASESQYYAAAAWAAAKLYGVTGKEEYRAYAEDYAARLLACQETGGLGLPLSGFFFRNEEKGAIVHFSHQSRDQIFVQALAACCENLPQSGRRGAWENAMRLYGAYLKGLMAYTAPYGMLPAGVFSMAEVEDEATFEYIHPRVDYPREKQNYRQQLENAVEIAPGYYVKCFPVWFSYRGNSALHLSMGKAASLLGLYFGDRELVEIAREQIYWTLGKNPSGQSLVYGEGSNYGQQYAALLGETVGEMPVGIQTLANGDEPYWPQANIATYREVWTTPPARWLWIAADLLKDGR